MSDALITIVDEDNNVIGEATKLQARDEKLIYRSVHVFLSNNKGELLLQWRSKDKILAPRQFDSSVGGGVDSGEEPDVAVRREMREELGLDQDVKFVGSYKCEKDKRTEKFSYLYTTKSNGPFSNWEREADAIDWFTEEDIDDLLKKRPYLFASGFTECFNAYKNR